MAFPLKEFQSFQKFCVANGHPENPWALIYLLLGFLSSGEGALNAVQESWMKGFSESLSEEKRKEASDKILELADELLDCLRGWRELAEEEGSEAVMEEILELGEAVLLETREMGEFSAIVREESMEILSDLCSTCGVTIPKGGYKKINLVDFDDAEIAEEVEEWILALTSFDKAQEASELEAGILVLFVKVFLFFVFFT
ncbi:hypothetical protein LEP1GSC047_0095 [Leptospira inadai serovar Lyme str. 10]|uniref:Uncharacterized protein n=2 Tax=Leptospira inadai serovar Lyme TaxID=293084 RepID=V6HF25_9LEPT|nr:hypothetical protein [Leptospira inadai]EQA38827.1 hypothetical protein LEP1GSC047_0095 [Leptospira inadai serovar Lyme str. 10]PNV74108.1 hypothetical protein BES34_015570 [Leptospira inadai serovar Lyme]